MIRGLQASILCALFFAGSGINLAATPDDCATLRKHGRNPEAHACYEALTRATRPLPSRRGILGN